VSPKGTKTKVGAAWNGLAFFVADVRKPELGRGCRIKRRVWLGAV